MVSPIEIQQINIEESVQLLPSVPKGAAQQRLFFQYMVRGPLLPQRGTTTRDQKLLEYYWNDHNLIFRSAVAGLIKRIQSTPWELQGDSEIVDLYQDVLLQSDFGRGWESFLSKLLLDYSRQDSGAYVELIGPGDPMQPMPGAVTGLSILPSASCLPTGDPEYPVVYMDNAGILHNLHCSRVVRFVDTPDGYEYAGEYGECALSRALPAVVRDILMNRYLQQSLDDNPPPGFMIMHNLLERDLQRGVEVMERERQTDTGGTWGRNVRLYGMHTETKPEITFIPYSVPPEKFDLERYKNINVKEIALAIGLDIQDVWELTGGNIGSATQSEILAQKSEGKAIGRILRSLERVINQALPASLSFEFQWRDPDEDNERAILAQTWVSIGQQLQAMGASETVVMQLLANQVEAVRDVITDEEGELRMPDTPTEPEEVQVTLPEIQEEPVAPGDTVEEDKALGATQSRFRSGLRRVAIAAQNGITPPSAVRATLRLLIQDEGERAYRDGLRDGDASDTELTPEMLHDIAVWRSAQQNYIARFAGELTNPKKEFGDTELNNRIEMWVNRALNPIYYMGLGEANKEARYMWVMNPLKEHCRTCLALNGQIHRMKDYIKSGLLPQSPKLECKGYQCGCSLKRSEGKAQGRIPGTTGRVAGTLARIAQGIRRLFGG